MQAKLVESKLRPWLRGVLSPGGHAGQAVPLFARTALAFYVRCDFRWWSVQGSLGMDATDEMNIGGQVRQNAFAAVGAITGDDEGIARKPARGEVNQFDGQLRTTAMIRVLLGFCLAFFAFGEALAIAIEAE